MARHNVYAGEAHFQMGRGRGMSFRPKGEVQAWDMETGKPLSRKAREKDNPVEKLEGSGLAARIFVGLKVGDKEKWTADDVVEIVIRVREEQKASPDASILTQRGIYKDSSGKVVDEPSLQIIIIDLVGLNEKDFTDEMSDLAEELVEDLEQESVVLEIQKRGVVVAQYWVTP